MNHASFPSARRALSLCGALCGLWLAFGEQYAAAQTHPPHSLAQGEAAVDRMTEAIVLRGLAQHARETGKPFCVENRFMSITFAPGTTPDYAQRALSQTAAQGIGMLYMRAARWGATATNPTTGSSGNPITLTYSFVPDGTPLDSMITGESSAPSSLFATLNAQFGGNTALWKAKFRDSFAHWSRACGVRFVEVSDDGASFPYARGSNAAPRRGDMRIASHKIDGRYGILGYCFFPNWGDMVLDSSENWAITGGDYRFLRNVIGHEAGHGIGLAHVWPLDHTKLMEPYLNTNFDGPQDDDSRAGDRNYGDPQEKNDGVSRATHLSVNVGLNIFAELSTDAAGDQDWFVMDAPSGYRLSVKTAPTGGAYSVGGSKGSVAAINTKAINALAVEVFASDGARRLAVAKASAAGGEAIILNLDLSTAGAKVYVRVFNAPGARDDIQRYSLTLEYRLASGGN